MTATILRTDAELGIIEQYLDRLRDVAVVTTTEHYDEPGLIQAAAGADLILTCYTEITAAVMNAAPNLKGIVKYGVGVNNIDLATATRNGVMVANCPAYGSDTVADHAFALLIALARKIPAIDRIMRKQAWAWPEPGLLGFDLAGKTLGLIGMGRIGRAMARRGQGFGMKVITVDPYVTADDIRPLEVEFTTLDELLDRSDFVSIHCILTPETRGLLDARRLSRMKPTAFLIDVSRGAIVDEDALIRAIKDSQIAGAGFDVFADEPLSPDYPLLGMDNVILTPHLAWYTHEAFQRVEEQTLESVLDILQGRTPKNLKNTELRAAISP